MYSVPVRAVARGAIVSMLILHSHQSVAAEPPIVVTASRVAQTADETLASVTVITRADIERSQARDTVSLLRGVAGIDVARTGGPGHDTSVFLRGANADHVLVLIDGVRVASATDGKFAWSGLDPGQIERIEIVRGPRASLYGSEAIGGVIQIFTRRPQGAQFAGELGAYRTRAVEAGFGIGDDLRFNALGSYRKTRGFSATHPGAGFIYDPDRDGSEQLSANVGFSARLGDFGEIDLEGLRTLSQVEFDPGNDYSDGEDLSGRARLRTTVGPWSQTLALSGATTDLETFGSNPSDIASRRRMIDWQNDFELGGGHLLTLGASRLRDRGRNVNTATETLVFQDGVHNNAGFANWLGRFGRLRVELGGRYDQHSNFGTHGTGQGAWGLVYQRWSLYGSYGTAFKAPTLNELFHPGFFGGQFAGNPDLTPETSRSAELGWRINPVSGLRLNGSGYYTSIENLIAFEGMNFQATNIGRATLRGVEFGAELTQGAWRVSTNLGLHKAVNEITDRDLLRRPRKKLSLAVDHETAGVGSVGAELIAVSSHADIDNVSFATIDVAGYVVVNLRARLMLSPGLSLEARIDNFLDEDYEVASGYNTPGLSPYLGLRYEPGRKTP